MHNNFVTPSTSALSSSRPNDDPRRPLTGVNFANILDQLRSVWGLFEAGNEKMAKTRFNSCVNEFDIVYQMRKAQQRFQRGGEWEYDGDKKQGYFDLYEVLIKSLREYFEPKGMTVEQKRKEALLQKKKIELA